MLDSTIIHADLAPIAGAPSPEARVLLCCARVTLGEAERQRLRALFEASLDWARLLTLAEWHGLSALLYAHLKAELAERCPAEVLARLAATVQTQAARGLALCAELGVLLDGLRARGVEPLVVKGPTASVLCYGRLGLRTFGDIDLLVRRNDALAAGELLRERGYAPHLSLTLEQQRWLVQSDHELLWKHPDGVRLVDVHWALMPRGYSFTPDDLGPFAARSQVRVGAIDVPTLGVEATLLFLLLHGMKHDFATLGWLCDVAELLRRTAQLDWDAVERWSAPTGRRRFVDIGLRLSQGLLGAPVPERLLARGRADPEVDRFATEIASGLLRATYTPQAALRAAFGLAYFRAMPVWGDRLRYVHDMLLRPTTHEWQAVPLPATLRPLYYAVRPARLAIKQARHRMASRPR